MRAVHMRIGNGAMTEGPVIINRGGQTIFKIPEKKLCPQIYESSAYENWKRRHD